MTDGGNGGERDDPLDEIDFEEFQLNEPASYDAPIEYETTYEPAPSLVSCPSCGEAQSASNRHCEQCGARLGSSSVAVAPRPLAAASAGTRALTIILAVLAGVVLIALLYTSIRGDDPGSDTTAVTVEEPTVTSTTGIIEPITPIGIECSTQLNDSTLACSNLISDDDAYWNDASLQGAGAVITVTFAEPVQLEQVQFINVADDASFRRNYRIRGLEIIADDLPGLPFIQEIPNDNDRPHAVTTPTLGTTQLRIRVTATWPSEPIDGRAFDELALDEIQFWGRLVNSATPETDNN